MDDEVVLLWADRVETGREADDEDERRLNGLAREVAEAASDLAGDWWSRSKRARVKYERLWRAMTAYEMARDWRGAHDQASPPDVVD